MTASKTPNVGLPAVAPVITREWVQGMGQEITHEWPLGTAEEIGTKFDTMAAEGEAFSNLRSLSEINRNGRVSLVARYGRVSNVGAEPGDGREEITTIEELYGVDLIQDLRQAPHFEDMTDDQIAWVDYCFERKWKEAEITAAAQARPDLHTGYEYSNWTDLMKALRGHYQRGQESYIATAFVLRLSHYSARSAYVNAAFTGINQVAATPRELTQKMRRLLGELPDGEWLKKPPQAEHLGRGSWRVTEEWIWAEQWSIVYGGTFTGLPAAPP